MEIIIAAIANRLASGGKGYSDKYQETIKGTASFIISDG